MEADLRRHLLATATGFAAARNLELVTVGRQAAGDWRFFERLQGEVSFTARKYDQIMGWFSKNWPEGVDWPADVPRPDDDSTVQTAAA